MKSKRSKKKNKNKKLTMLVILTLLVIVAIIYGICNTNKKQTNIAPTEETNQDIELQNYVTENAIRRYY